MPIACKAPPLLLMLLLQQQSLLEASDMGGIRTSHHAGSWFPGTQEALQSAVDSMLAAAPSFHGKVKAITVPHAGYMYSGKTAAVGFKQIAELKDSVQRAVVLAPWHRGVRGVLLPPEEYSGYGTPLGTMPLDTEGILLLQSTGLYEVAPSGLEAEEHSISVQIPFLSKVLPQGAAIVPIYVGVVTDEELALYAETLLTFFMDAGTVFVVSTDWSHWGPRYGYQYLPKGSDSSTPLHERIKAMDMEAVNCVLSLDLECLENHRKETGNQICGYEALRLLLTVIHRVASYMERRPEDLVQPALLTYSQSDEISSPSENAVGYAAIGFFSP